MRTLIFSGFATILLVILVGSEFLFSENRQMCFNHLQDSCLIKTGSEHIMSRDYEVIDAAFLHGYTHNIVNENIDGKKMSTLTIQCTNGKVHSNLSKDYNFSVWTRDLYWGFLGWAEAGNDSVIEIMKSSLSLLVMAKNKHQALGQNRNMPLNDGRFYVPQAYTKGLKPSAEYWPWCAESQADFLLLARNYWKLSGDLNFISSIWNDIVYIIETLELMDSDGNSLPDTYYGSYDYQGVIDAEEPLLCAKTSLAYSSIAELANMLGKDEYGRSLEKLASKIKETMNKNIDDGGLWKAEEEGGYYINMRKFTESGIEIIDNFIPYDNLVPMWCGMTSSRQDKAIFSMLDNGFKEYYDLTYGPMYCAPAGHNNQSVMECSSVTWLAFLDIYLRGKKGHDVNRSKIFDLLMKNAYIAGEVPFSEGAGIYGTFTGNAGRSWDNGNFFHMLICGVYGIEKSQNGISISPPESIEGNPLTELLNLHWRRAVYDFKWNGMGNHIKTVTVDGKKVAAKSGIYMLTSEVGNHEVAISLY